MNEPNSSSTAVASDSGKPRWRELNRIDRRIAGVLVEKAKTTPDQYPMTINGLVSGANQKSNRDPQMQLEENDIVDSLDRLKAAGAVVEIQGGGRVPKFRHLMYEWLGVDKVELAVMAELLLRGAQTEGELRGRASRMEPIADLNALRGILDSLRSKRLVIDITPPGRGQIISHNLYEPEELQRLKARHADGASESDESRESPRSTIGTSSHSSPAGGSAIVREAGADLRSLRSEIAELRQELESLTEKVRRQEETISDLRSSIGG